MELYYIMITFHFISLHPRWLSPTHCALVFCSALRLTVLLEESRFCLNISTDFCEYADLYTDLYTISVFV